MFVRVSAAILGLALFAAGTRGHAAGLELREVTARVVVVAEPRSDVKVTVLTTNPALPLTISRTDDGGALVDGRSEHRRDWLSWIMHPQLVQCRGREGHDDQLPSLLVRVPLDADIRASGMVIGSLPTAQSLELHTAGCGGWTIGHVTGRFELEDAGADNVRAGDVGELKAHLSGAGKVTVRNVVAGLEVHLAGASDVKAGQVSGPIELHIAGHGDVDLGPGHSSHMSVEIAGQGDVAYAGVVERLDVSIAGQGDVSVAQVTGSVNKSVAGQGTVTIGGVRKTTAGLGVDHSDN